MVMVTWISVGELTLHKYFKCLWEAWEEWVAWVEDPEDQA